jgi:ribosomal protein S18 acetylase RimI-like enzyme
MHRSFGALFDTLRSLVCLVGCCATSALAANTLHLEATIPLGDAAGRIDHLAVDPARRRLFVAELVANRVAVIDLDGRTVLRTIDRLAEPQGVAYEPTTDTLYVANGGDGSVRLYSAATFESIGRIELRDDADNVRIDATNRRVLVGYGHGLAAIDPRTHALRTFALGGHPEAFQVEPKTGRTLINVPRAHAVVALDANGRVQRRPIPLPGANYPMALDDLGQLVLPLRHPAQLLVMHDHRTATAELCDDADDVFFDARRKRLYVSCGDGHLDVFERRATNYARIDAVTTAPGARTSLFVAPWDRLYLAVPAGADRAAAVWVMAPN